jgi:TolB-like protein/class 3 adenylate cyclase/tetratricopeptide (TPR) repeat protein
MTLTRRLATILTINVAGYSHLLGGNEKGALILTATRRLADEVGYSGLIRAGEEGMFERLNAHRRQLVDPKIAEHHGRILKTTGDRMLVEFAGPVEAVRCAVEIQRVMAERNADTVADKRITFCVGLDLGNLSADGDPIDSDRVGAAVSLEALAEPGGICISRTVHDLIRDKLPYKFKDIGEQRGKNIAMPVRAYAMSAGAVASISEVTAKPEPVLAPRRFSPRSAVIAASVAATIGVWTAAWWAWLGGSSSTAPTQLLVAAGPQISPEIATAADTSAVDKSAQAPPRPTLSIVVLPFANLSGDPDQEYFVDGITEDLIADVSRFPGSFVVARNTAFTYKGQPVDARQVGHDLGVRYVLEGGVQRAGEQVRLNAQLIDTETEARPWAEQIDTNRTNFADAQNGLIGHLARTLDPQLVPISAAEIAPKTVDPDAREMIMRGRGWSSRPYSAATWQEAQRAFERALEIDSRSVEARVGLAEVLGGKLADGWSSSRQQDPARAEQLLREALERDANRSTAHFAMGVLRRMQNRLTEAQSEFETAIRLNRNDARAFYQLGLTLMFLGHPEAGIPDIEQAIRLDPQDPNMSTLYWALGTCHLLLGQVDEAIDFLGKARAANSRLWFPHLYVAGAFGLRGDVEPARAALAESITLKPEINSVARMRVYNAWITNSEHWALQEKTLNVGLRRAGLPDE